MLLRTVPSFVLIALKFKILSERQPFCHGGLHDDRTRSASRILERDLGKAALHRKSSCLSNAAIIRHGGG